MASPISAEIEVSRCRITVCVIGSSLRFTLADEGAVFVSWMLMRISGFRALRGRRGAGGTDMKQQAKARQS